MSRRVVLAGPVFPYRGAISLSTVRLGEELAKYFEVDILSFSRQYPKRFYPGGDDIDETVRHLAPAGARYALDILNPWSWVREGLRVRRERPDVLLIVWWVWVWAIPYFVFAWCAGKRVPLVIQCHNVADKEPSALKTFCTNLLFRRARALITHSQTGVDELVERLGPPILDRARKLFLPVLPIGREVPSREDAKSAFGLAGRNVALFFGHIRPFKGLDIAIRAWSQLSTDAVLLVAGEVWWASEDEIRALAKDAGVENRVVFHLGYIPDSDVARYFAAADVVIAPYRREAQSGVAMNSFHFGRAVIASAVGGIPEVIRPGVNGDLVPPEDPAALARAVDAFFTSADRAALERGVVESAAQFSWERFGEAVRDIVNEG